MNTNKMNSKQITEAINRNRRLLINAEYMLRRGNAAYAQPLEHYRAEIARLELLETDESAA